MWNAENASHWYSSLNHLKDQLHTLIKRCQQGDRDSQTALFKLFLPYVTSICKRYLHNASLLQDVVQEAFLLIFKSLPSSFQEEKGALKPWIRKIAINSSLKFNQRYQGFEELAQQEYEKKYFAIAEITSKTSDQEIMLLIRAIPTSYREVFNLYAIDGYSHQEIAQLLGISIESSRKKLQRARANLQEQIKRQQKINFTKSA